MDFFQICTKEGKGVVEVYPDFFVGRSKDLMVRGRSFSAIWDEAAGLWSTDEYDVQRLVDKALADYAEEQKAIGVTCSVKFLRSYGSNGWNQFRKFLSNISDNSHQLDESLTFANTDVKKTDYVSRRLPYSLQAGDYSAWDELVGTLYSPEEREKIEWAIGAVISGDSKKLQKFLVLYGPGGTGKSTILNIIAKLFVGYTASFEAKALVGNNNSFATEIFRNNPLVAIQHDGDLSKIEDNTKLNSIISHEEMTMNEKYKPSFTAKIMAFLYMGTNKPVRITDAKSGVIRRLIDVHPTGKRIPPNHYQTLMSRIDFELGAIAQRCLDVYRELGKNFYNNYRPLEMMLQTDVFFNFIEAHFDIFKEQDGVSLKQAYILYKQYVADTGLEFSLPQYKVREELRNYFREFHDRFVVNGTTVRSYYEGFSAQPFKSVVAKDKSVFSLVLDETTSIFDMDYAEQPAQLAKDDGTPSVRWSMVKTTLSVVDTAQVHYVKVPENHIVIDFDLRDDDGAKSLERNLRAASDWPATYGEISRSGSGVHLHYIYDGPTDQLATVYSDGIEVKVFAGNSSLRRRLSKCNNVPIATISGGLPLKEKKMLAIDTIKSEKGLRELIARNLRKEIHPGTKPSIDFIAHILEEAYASGLKYDVNDMRSALVSFANNSSNQHIEALKVVQKMKFKSEEIEAPKPVRSVDARIVFFDIEVFPNLFVICWKFRGAGKDTMVKMINPTPAEIEDILRLKLVGFNNRRYDNHMLWARMMGYDNEACYKLSQKIIDGNIESMFGEAYNASYADVYDFSSVKQGLKKFQIDLGIFHMELNLPWDEPVKDEDVPKVVEYCCNDVESLELVFESRLGDYKARQILAELSGLSVNDTTQAHTAKIVFGNDRNPQREFVYTNLADMFPGYVYDHGKSTYRGETVGEGGYVYAEPGMYENVALLDVASMHPTSIIELHAFGDYTGRFKELLDARLAIKAKDYARAETLLGGKLAPYLGSPADSDALSYALKIVINIVYGLTSAKFDNKFRDRRNVDNIVAKRGALFMIDLKHFVQERGFTVAHIKTDSIKIPDATPEIIRDVKLFGEKYGYKFEYDPEKDFYDSFCLVNDAVYIARSTVDGKTKWTAVGAQFQHKYVYKKLFTGEPICFEDYCEAKSVTQGAMYLDFSDIPQPMFGSEGLHFVGRTGLFVPVTKDAGGGVLYRIKDDKQYAVTGTKNHLWLEAEMAKGLTEDYIDIEYFEKLVKAAQDAIEYYGEWARFIGDDGYGSHAFEDVIPWED
jgi:energy-coupling factor transporter ATP-binding protein EcfA2